MRTRNFEELIDLPSAIISIIDEKMKQQIKSNINQAMIELNEPKRAIDIMNTGSKEENFVLQITSAILETTPAGKAFNLITSTNDGTLTLNPSAIGTGLISDLAIGVNKDLTNPGLGEIAVTIGAAEDNNTIKIGHAIRSILHGGPLNNRPDSEVINKHTISPNENVIKEIGQKITTYFANDIINKGNLEKEIEKALKE